MRGGGDRRCRDCQRGSEFIDGVALEEYADEQDDYAQEREIEACIKAVDVDCDGKIGNVQHYRKVDNMQPEDCLWGSIGIMLPARMCLWLSLQEQERCCLPRPFSKGGVDGDEGGWCLRKVSGSGLSNVVPGISHVVSTRLRYFC